MWSLSICVEQVMKVLKQAMQGTVRDVTLDWSLPPEVKVTAVPEKVPSIFSGDKLIMYAIMKGAVSIVGCIIFIEDSWDFSYSSSRIPDLSILTGAFMSDQFEERHTSVWVTPLAVSIFAAHVIVEKNCRKASRHSVLFS